MASFLVRVEAPPRLELASLAVVVAAADVVAAVAIACLAAAVDKRLLLSSERFRNWVAVAIAVDAVRRDWVERRDCSKVELRPFVAYKQREVEACHHHRLLLHLHHDHLVVGAVVEREHRIEWVVAVAKRPLELLHVPQS